MKRFPPLLGLLLGVLLCGLTGVAVCSAVARAHPARAAAYAGVPTTAQIDAVAIPAVDGLIARQEHDGTFNDPIRGIIAKGGLTRVVWVALHQASRLTGEAALARLRMARRSLSRGVEGTQLLPKWPLTLVAEDGLQNMLSNPAPLEETVANLGVLHASGIADDCYQRTDGCFNNYRLTSEVLNLELARTGLHSGAQGARLADPVLRTRTLHWLGTNLPLTTSETATVLAPGSKGRHTAAALSDPAYYPLAYQAFCTAMLTRAAALGGRELPAAAWRLERAALWELVGMTAPDGEISWMGRGQDEVWTLAAAFYAGVEGSKLMAQSAPSLAARLRRLAGVELAALQARLGPIGLRPKPNGDLTGAGIDGYASAIGNASLALVWIELAREVAATAAGPVAPLPSERSGGASNDPYGDGLLTLRHGNVWLGVHRVSDDDDPRLGWGMLRAMRRLPDGRWVSLAPERPLSPRGSNPPSGPVLVRGGLHFQPQVARGGVGKDQIALSGVWRSTVGSVPGRWVWRAMRAGVRLTTNCPRGASLRFTEWLPRTGALERGRAEIERGGFRVSFSRAITVRTLPGLFSSAREPHLQAYRVAVRCDGTPVSVSFSGGELASG